MQATSKTLECSGIVVRWIEAVPPRGGEQTHGLAGLVCCARRVLPDQRVRMRLVEPSDDVDVTGEVWPAGPRKLRGRDDGLWSGIPRILANGEGCRWNDRESQ